ncbi:MAG TPA: CPBP family intramembrane glutamic endopeptidase [Pyrinomonadaceae bacterium]
MSFKEGDNAPSAVGASDAAFPGERALAAWEIASLTVSTLIAEWVVFSLGGGSNLLLAVPLAFAFVFMFCSHRLRGETARDIGLCLDNFAQAMRLLILPMLVTSALLVLVGILSGNDLNFGKWRGGQSIFGVPALGFLWGLMQQYALQAFINRRAQILWGKGFRSVFLVAFLFGLLHFPNPWLTAATFAGGLLWAWVYQRAPNLFALALSHMLMTWVLVSTVPASALRGLRVGYKFFG